VALLSVKPPAYLRLREWEAVGRPDSILLAGSGHKPEVG
jgi:hypothetical protein